MPSSRIATCLLAVATIALLVLGADASQAAGAKPVDAKPAVSSQAPVLDTDYFVIENAPPPTGTKVQVVEVFGYGCPICAAFQPHLADWEKTMPADVQFSYLPAAFGPDPEHCWDDFARAFYAAQAMGVQAKSHDSIYKAKFEQFRIATCEAIPSVYADYGIDPKRFASTMQSFPVTVQLGKAHDQALRWGVDGTPMMVVDGKYRVALTRAGGAAGMLHTVDWLIARQRPLHAASHARKH